MTNKLLVTIGVFLLSFQTNVMAIEEPDYKVIDTYAGFEVRQYEPYLVAEVDVDGDMNRAGNKAFRILAGYIFGDNAASANMEMTTPVETTEIRQGEKMQMTAPVTSTAAEVGQRTTVAFVMEGKYTIENLPTPNDERIRIRQVPLRIMAVRRYSGRWTDARYQQNREQLVNAIESADIEAVSEPILARYNSPFSLPMLRRNEVMVEIKAPRLSAKSDRSRRSSRGD
jgi:hypothetical protein